MQKIHGKLTSSVRSQTLGTSDIERTVEITQVLKWHLKNPHKKKKEKKKREKKRVGWGGEHTPQLILQQKFVTAYIMVGWYSFINPLLKCYNTIGSQNMKSHKFI